MRPNGVTAPGRSEPGGGALGRVDGGLAIGGDEGRMGAGAGETLGATDALGGGADGRTDARAGSAAGGGVDLEAAWRPMARGGVDGAFAALRVVPFVEMRRLAVAVDVEPEERDEERVARAEVVAIGFPREQRDGAGYSTKTLR